MLQFAVWMRFGEIVQFVRMFSLGSYISEETEIKIGCSVYEKDCSFFSPHNAEGAVTSPFNDPDCVGLLVNFPLLINIVFMLEEIMLVHTRITCWTICPPELFAAISRLSTAVCNETSS